MHDDLDLCVVASTLQSSTGLFVRWHRQASDYGDLTVPEVAALSCLERTGSATSGEIARAEQITPQCMEMTLSVLEDRGLIERGSDLPTSGGLSSQ